METKMRHILLGFILISLCAGLFAQAQVISAAGNGNDLIPSIADMELEKEGAFYIQKDEGAARIVQLFSWEADEYVFMYNFLLQMKNEDGVFEDYISEDLEQNYYECSLSPGEYRYRIGLYNFLEIIELETDWIYVEIEEAIQPVVKKLSPGKIYLDEKIDGTFKVKGSGINEGSVMILRNVDGDLEMPVELKETGAKGTSFVLSADTDLFVPGTYALSIRNEGGLSFEAGPVRIREQKPFNLTFSLGYSPVFVFDCRQFSTYFNNETNILLAGTARITFLPVKTSIGNFGININGTGMYQSVEEQERYKLNAPMIGATGSLVYQFFVIPKVLCIDVHAGAGVVGFVNMKFIFADDVVSDGVTEFGLAYTGGLAIDYRIGNSFYIEAGVDYLLGKAGGMKIQYVEPSVSLGIKY